MSEENLSYIPICFCGNAKIFHGLVLSVLSIVKHVSRPVKFYIFTMDLRDRNINFTPITSDHAKILEKIVKDYNLLHTVVAIDATEEYLKAFSKSKNANSGYTPYALNRLLFDRFDLPEKVIYLDIDTMCLKDISALYDIDVSGYEFAAVHDILGRYWIKPSYCNSGVMLLNLKAVQETGLFEKCRKRINNVKMIMPDQTSLNCYVKNKFYLPYKFNEQRKIRQDTVIKHFCQGLKWYGPFFKIYNYKQWDRKNVHEKLKIHDFDDIYEIYDELDKKYHFKDWS